MILTDDQLIEALTEAGHDDIADALTAKLKDGNAPDAKAPAKEPAKASFGDRLRAAAG